MPWPKAAAAFTHGKVKYDKLEEATVTRDAAERSVRAAQAFVEATEIAEIAARTALDDGEAKLKAAKAAALSAEVLLLRAKAAHLALPFLEKIDELRAAVTSHAEALAQLREIDGRAAENIAPNHWTFSVLVLNALAARFTAQNK